MIGFLAGGCATLLIGTFLLITAPVWWLLTGGDFDGHHWLLDGDGSLWNRWKWREFNGHDPNRR